MVSTTVQTVIFALTDQSLISIYFRMLQYNFEYFEYLGYFQFKQLYSIESIPSCLS